ncbi:aminotransferase class V-fold PLP-dependent enzyme [Kineococcus arenarius]|uniref:aminotransferase class V-fold PLP-dependent enzyme n=1 Tax=unclassified Kineococcus TaxID=2621656 RepID=UPI003D7D0396
MDATAFRAAFPALQRYHWLDTPGSPPMPQPVAQALTQAVAQMLSGDFDWLQIDARPLRVRRDLAHLHGVDEADVALLSSVAEAAATVAGSLPPGTVLVPAGEFRSALLPWRVLDQQRNPTVLVEAEPGQSLSQALAAKVGVDTALVAVSSVLSSDGLLVDLQHLRAVTGAVGAQLFVDATQSFGVLGPAVADLRPDYLAVHGYKWMLCPRGAAWMVVRPDRQAQLRPLAPGWKSTSWPYGYFGPVDQLAAGAHQLDTQTAWLPWVGAGAAVQLHASLDPRAVRTHCLTLADRLRAGLRELGLSIPGDGQRVPAAGSSTDGSHIVVATSDDERLDPQLLEERGVRALCTPARLRLGVHYFNDESDVDAVLRAVRDSLKTRVR